MTLKQFADEEIDRLLSSQIAFDPELADLARFLTELRSEHIIEPSPAEVERLARSTAAVVRSRLAPVRPSPRSQRPRSRLTALKTYSTTATAMLALVVFSGLGLAANASVPGDFLYGLDLAMERVGIGAGSLQERISEAQVLAERGQHTQAADHLKAAITNFGDQATAQELSQAKDALDEYIVDSDETPNATLPPANENTGPANNNAGGNNETNKNTGPGNNNAGGNNETNENTGPGNNNAGGNNETNENTGPGN
ncbi:MAG: hypothetical protein ACFCU2_00990, partial [Acidimicrobiia bacterium]